MALMVPAVMRIDSPVIAPAAAPAKSRSAAASMTRSSSDCSNAMGRTWR
jgi:hypothetical protein